MNRSVGSFAAAGAFGTAVGVLEVAGRGDLAAPPLDDIGRWADARGPVVAAVALLRVAALAVAAWMLVVALVGAVAEVFGATALAGAAQRALPPMVRRILSGVAGAGAAGVVVLGASGGASPGSAAAPVPVERLVRLPDVPPEPAPVETMSVLEEPGAPTVPAADTWVVQPGDSFWSIAEEVLTETAGRAPSDREVDPYWRRLIEANRDRLATGDPDLLFPGQVIVLVAS